MKRNHKPAQEFAAFENLLSRIVRVPHSEIKAKLDAEKREKQKPSKKRASVRASSDKG